MLLNRKAQKHDIGKIYKALVFLFHACYIKYAKVIKYNILD